MHGCATALEAFLNNATSAFLLRVKPASTFPPALLNFGISWAATVLGFSPAFNLFNKVDVLRLPHPRLKVNEVNAPNWLSFRRTFGLTASLTHLVKVLTSFWRS